MLAGSKDQTLLIELCQITGTDFEEVFDHLCTKSKKLIDNGLL